MQSNDAPSPTSFLVLCDRNLHFDGSSNPVHLRGAHCQGTGGVRLARAGQEARNLTAEPPLKSCCSAGRL
jgi:hypothetical protein